MTGGYGGALLAGWIAWAQRSRLPEFVKLAKTIEHYRSFIQHGVLPSRQLADLLKPGGAGSRRRRLGGCRALGWLSCSLPGLPRLVCCYGFRLGRCRLGFHAGGGVGP